MEYFNQGNFVVSWDEELKAVVGEFLGYVTPETMKAGCEAGLKLLVEKEGCRWLAYSEKLPVFNKEMEEWFATDFVPREIAAGLRWGASVVPTSTLGRMSVNSTTAKIPGTELTFANFDDREKARAWL